MVSAYRPQADGIPLIEKAPDAVLDYPVDWSAWLQVGETIASHDTTVPDGLTLFTETSNQTSVTPWLKDGALGSSYLVTVEITTSQGRTDSRSFRVRIVLR